MFSNCEKIKWYVIIKIAGDEQANIVNAQSIYKSTRHLTYLAVKPPWSE